MKLPRLCPAVSAVLLGASLAACSSLGWDNRPAPLAVPRHATVTEPQDPEWAPPVPRPRPVDQPSAKADPPPRLIGLSEAETRTLLGPPTEESEQPPAKVWTYRSGGCELAVHLFPDMDKGGFFALDYTSPADSREACLMKMANEVRREKAAKPG